MSDQHTLPIVDFTSTSTSLSSSAKQLSGEPGAQDTPSEDSESEYQHALEVVFDNDSVHRRRSSLNSDKLKDKPSKSAERRQDTACFVHSLLEGKRRGRRKPQRSPSCRESPLENIHENDDTQADKVGEGVDDHQRKRREETTDGDGSGEGEEGAHNATHSRLLTKRQLSDMAWGVRELSKHLGSVRLKLKVKTVFLLTKAHDETLIAKTREMVEWLLARERGGMYIVYVEDTLEHNKIFDAPGLVAQAQCREGRLKYWTNELCAKRPDTFDFVITLGGDGTLLYASWLFQRIVPPVLSFALGSLGFLTKFDYASFGSTLTTAFTDGVTVSLRLRFEGTVMRSQKNTHPDPNNDDQQEQAHDSKHRDLVEELIGTEAINATTHRPSGSYSILNDIVVDRGPNPTMSAIEIFGDDEHFTTIQADGVCVATPTGSTAYNLAAGGSLCHPENPVILLTAICAHTLSFRPIILPDTIVLRVGVPYDARTSSWASFDGRERVELCPGDYVTVSASRFPFANVMKPGRRSEDWVGSISRTLNWNSRQRQKEWRESEKE